MTSLDSSSWHWWQISWLVVVLSSCESRLPLQVCLQYTSTSCRQRVLLSLPSEGATIKFILILSLPLRESSQVASYSEAMCLYSMYILCVSYLLTVTVGDRAFPVAAAINCGMNFPVTSPLPCLWLFSSSAENFFVSCILSGFIICTVRRFAIAVCAFNITWTRCCKSYL